MSGSGAPTSPATYRVLLVDDNLAIHADFGKIFRQRSASSADLDALDEELFGETPASRGAPSVFLLTSAQQGEEALRLVTEAKASGEPFALAFVDIRMPPGWDGVETVCRLWQVDPTLQVVICTAHSDYTFRDIVERLGLSDGLLVIKKPFEIGRAHV